MVLVIGCSGQSTTTAAVIKNFVTFTRVCAHHLHARSRDFAQQSGNWKFSRESILLVQMFGLIQKTMVKLRQN